MKEEKQTNIGYKKILAERGLEQNSKNIMKVMVERAMGIHKFIKKNKTDK
ncbi:MAG: hypothetical protein K0R00_116 [Herbinix sp.]|jgi:hypothetical protein|nr:hypothetical protein [Herbinix sp.]